MAPPTFATSIMWFESPVYNANPELFSQFSQAARETDGNIRHYNGVQTEDESQRIWLNIWKSPESHEPFKAAKWEEFKATAQLVGPPKMTWVTTLDTAEDLYKSTDAPATEIVEIKLKSEHDDKLEELDSLMDELIAALRVAEGNLGASKGKNLKDDKMYVHIIGWTSVQAHWDAVKEGTLLGDIIKRFLVIADIQFIKHAILSSN